MDALAKLLEQEGATVEPEITNLVGELPYIVQFASSEHAAVTTLRIVLKDHQTDSDVVITNMTTLPPNKRRLGLGSEAIRRLLRWATNNHLNEVRGTQVSDTSESLLRKAGFEKCPIPNPCNDFVHRIRSDRPGTP